MLQNGNKAITKGIQINLRKSHVATTNLLRKCEQLDSYILFLQEPIYNKNNRIKLHHKIKTHYHVDNTDRQVRVAIGHTSDLEIFSIPNLTDHDTCTALWNKTDSDEYILLVSAYWDCKQNNIPDKLKQAIAFANNKGFKYIIGMDSNAHSTTWGCPRDDVRGTTLEEFIATNDAAIGNIGNNPTFQTFRENRIIQSIIDLTLYSSNYICPFTNWNISDSFEGSDHRMIHIYTTTINVTGHPSKKHWTKNLMESCLYNGLLRKLKKKRRK
jgi:hypothetical protein